MKRFIISAGLAAGVFVVACSDRSADLVEPTRQNSIAAADSVFIRQGNGQIGIGGAQLPQPLSILVRNGGVPVARARGTLTVTSGGGTASSGVFYTNSKGVAVFYWTLGASGPQTVTATLDGGNSVVFNARAIPVGSTLTIVGGNGQMAVPGDTLALNIAVELRDPLGAVLADVPVHFATSPAHGGGTRYLVNPTRSTGRSQNRWALGWGATAQTLTAFVPGIDTVVFNATTSNEGVLFRVIKGNAQTGNPGTPLSTPVTVELTKRGVPVPRVSGTFSVTGGGGILSQSTFTTTSLGRAFVTWTPGTAAPQQQLTASIGAGFATSSATATANQGTFITNTSRSKSIVMSRHHTPERQFNVSWRVSSTVHLMGVTARLLKNGNRTIGGTTPQQVSCSGQYNIGAGIHDETCVITVPHGAASGVYDIEFLAGADTVVLSDTLGITLDDTNPLTLDEVIIPRSVVSQSEPALGGGYRGLAGFQMSASSSQGIEYMSALVNPNGHYASSGGCSWPAFIPEYPNPAVKTCSLAIPPNLGTYDVEVQVVDRAQNRVTHTFVGAITVVP